MNVDDPTVPFARVRETFHAADLVFSNLECCLYTPPQSHSFHTEGFFADPAIGGEALRHAGIGAVGIANNVNYGEAAILASDRAPGRDRHSPHRRRREPVGGTGADRAVARWPALGIPAAQLGVLADQPRGRPARCRHRSDPRSYRLPGADAQDPAGDPANEPAGHSAGHRHLGRCRLPARVQGRHRGTALTGGCGRRIVPLGAAQGRADLHARHRARRDRRRRRCRDRSRSALFAGRSRSTAATPSSTDSAASLSTPGMADARTATGSA